jgi:hypothetical protein
MAPGVTPMGADCCRRFGPGRGCCDFFRTQLLLVERLEEHRGQGREVGSFGAEDQSAPSPRRSTTLLPGTDGLRACRRPRRC